MKFQDFSHSHGLFNMKLEYDFSIGDKTFTITPYCTKQEKELLLLSSFEQYDLDKALKILGFQTNYELTDDEKKVILYKYREISIGDEIDIRFVCDDCKFVNETKVEAKNFVIPGKRNDSDVKKFAKPFDEENMHEYVNLTKDDIENLDIDEYEALKQKIIENQVQISFVKEVNCLKCNKPKRFNLGATKYVIDVLSEDTLMTLYKAYNFLIFFGHYTKTDIDNMYPFERSIFIGLLTKTKEDLNKK